MSCVLSNLTKTIEEVISNSVLFMTKVVVFCTSKYIVLYIITSSYLLLLTECENLWSTQIDTLHSLTISEFYYPSKTYTPRTACLDLLEIAIALNSQDRKRVEPFNVLQSWDITAAYLLRSHHRCPMYDLKHARKYAAKHTMFANKWQSNSFAAIRQYMSYLHQQQHEY